jgi:hypothetical protein
VGIAFGVAGGAGVSETSTVTTIGELVGPLVGNGSAASQAARAGNNSIKKRPNNSRFTFPSYHFVHHPHQPWGVSSGKFVGSDGGGSVAAGGIGVSGTAIVGSRVAVGRGGAVVGIRNIHSGIGVLVHGMGVSVGAG